jgi:hypothetical protein
VAVTMAVTMKEVALRAGVSICPEITQFPHLDCRDPDILFGHRATLQLFESHPGVTAIFAYVTLQPGGEPSLTKRHKR